MDRTTPTRVLLDALAKIPADDTERRTATSLLGMLLGQPADVLRQQRRDLAQAGADGEPARWSCAARTAD